MRNFFEFYSGKEKDNTEQVNSAFSDAENKVKEIFGYLHKLMINTWGKQSPTWDKQVRDKVINDLQNVIDKLKGNTNGQTVNGYKEAIRESIIICEGKELPSWLQNITGKNRTITVDRMLSTMQSEIIKILHTLKNELTVKQAMTEVGKVGRRLSRRVGAIGKGIQQQIASGVRVHKEISGEDRDSARYNLIRLYNALKRTPEIRLYSSTTGTRQLKFDPNNQLQMAQILDKLSKGPNFRVRINGKDHFFDITSESDTNRTIELIGEYEGV